MVKLKCIDQNGKKSKYRDQVHLRLKKKKKGNVLVFEIKTINKTIHYNRKHMSVKLGHGHFCFIFFFFFDQTLLLI